MSFNRFRKIHMDYHNSSFIPDIAADYNGESFAKTLKDAHVDAVVVFGKCCHGFAYYPSNAGPRHPALTFDLLGDMIENCKKQDIKTSVYYCVGWEVEAFAKNPDWRQKNKDGSDYLFSPQFDGWQALCLNSPYVEEQVIPQIREICSQYPADGIWFDMVLVTGGVCYCSYCQEKMKERGLNPENPQDVKYLSQNVTCLDFMKKLNSVIHEYNEDLVVDFNNQVRIGARGVVPHMSNLEIEALPHFWGYLYYPLYSRHVRTLGIPFNGITGRFHKSWGEFGGLKNEVQLIYEVSSIIANGGQCSIGDQLHPRGRLEPSTYKLIGKAYEHVRAREAWCSKATMLAQIAVIADLDDNAMGVGAPTNALWGITKMLIESHHQFDIIDFDANLHAYELVILPENADLPKKAVENIKSYADKGGKLLLVKPDSNEELWNEFIRSAVSIEVIEPSPFSVNYMRLKEAVQSEIDPFDYVVYGHFTNIKPLPEAEVLSDTVNPYFERTAEHWTSHMHAPADRLSEYPSMVKKGDIVYVAAPLASSYFENGNTVYRKIMENAIDLLLPDKWIRTSASTTVEVTLSALESKTIVHFVNYHNNLRGLSPEVMEEIPQRCDIPTKVKHTKKPTQVYLVPETEPIIFDYENNYVSFTLPRLHIHQMVVIE